jgi:hypothetical protein
MKRHIIIASLFGLFIFGGVCGFALAVKIVKNTLNEQHWVSGRRKEEAKRLKLTAEQMAKAQPSYDALQQSLGKVKDDTIAGITAATAKQAAELAALLTPEQLQEFKKLSDERARRNDRISKKP